MPRDLNLTAEQNETYLLFKYPEYPELYSRFEFTIYGPVNGTYLLRKSNVSEVSAAGKTSMDLVSPLFTAEVNKIYESFQIVEYNEDTSIITLTQGQDNPSLSLQSPSWNNVPYATDVPA
jgi:hypothetical protein